MMALASLAREIVGAHEAAVGAAQSALSHARRAGDLLLDAKAQCRHGDWLPWLQTHCPTISERTAQGYMRLARCWPELEAKSATVADLPLRDALALLAQPRDAGLPQLQTPLPDDFDWLERAHQTDEAWEALGNDLDAFGRSDKPDTIEGWMGQLREADALVARAVRLKMIALCDLGLLLQQHPWVEPLLGHPELLPQFFGLCDARVIDLARVSGDAV